MLFDFELDISINEYSPLVLAYVGDAVYEIFIRTKLSSGVNMPVNKLHKEATRFVRAKSQSKISHFLEDKLTEEELRVYKRGRNASSNTHAKNADIVDYRHATGFEALVGYLYLSKNEERLNEILELSYNYIIENE